MIPRVFLVLLFVLNVVLNSKAPFANETEMHSVDLLLDIQKKVAQRTSARGKMTLGVLTALTASSGLGAVIDDVRVPHAVLKSRSEGHRSPQSILIDKFRSQCPSFSRMYAASESDSIQVFDAICMASHDKKLDDLIAPWQAKTSEEIRKELAENLIRVQDIFSRSHDLRAFYGEMGLENDIATFVEKVTAKAPPNSPVIPVLSPPTSQK